MYRNIMVPVDGSPFSKEAVLQGLRIASQSGATLRLVRVGTSSVLSGAPDALAIENDTLRQIQASELASLYSILMSEPKKSRKTYEHLVVCVGFQQALCVHCFTCPCLL